MRRERSFVLLLVAAVALGGYIYFVERKRPASDEPEKKPPVFENVEEGTIEEMVVSSGDDRTHLKKTGDAWQIVEPITASADQEQTSNLAANLATLERTDVVEENPSDLKEFGLDPPRAEVGFRTKGSNQMRALLVGNRTPTGGELYAQVKGEKRLILISGFMESVFVRSTFDLRNKSVLAFERDKVENISIDAGNHSVRLARQGNDWRIAEPLQVRADYGTVESVLGQLTAAQMRSLVSEDAPPPDALRRYGLEKPAMQVSVSGGGQSSALLIGSTAPEGRYYARTAARPSVFTVDAALVDELKKPAGDFRRKDLFEFRPFNASRVEVVRAGQTAVFERVKQQEKTAPTSEIWRQSAPSTRDVDLAKMDGFLSAFSNLRAEQWQETPPAGNQDVTVSVTFDDGKKQERVSFVKAGTEVFAQRPDEPGAAKIAAADYDTAVRGLDDVLK